MTAREFSAGKQKKIENVEGSELESYTDYETPCKKRRPRRRRNKPKLFLHVQHLFIEEGTIKDDYKQKDMYTQSGDFFSSLPKRIIFLFHEEGVPIGFVNLDCPVDSSDTLGMRFGQGCSSRALSTHRRLPPSGWLCSAGDPRRTLVQTVQRSR